MCSRYLSIIGASTTLVDLVTIPLSVNLYELGDEWNWRWMKLSHANYLQVTGTRFTWDKIHDFICVNFDNLKNSL